MGFFICYEVAKGKVRGSFIYIQTGTGLPEMCSRYYRPIPAILQANINLCMKQHRVGFKPYPVFNLPCDKW